ncbi:hypothetical protein GCM10022235_00960 [Kribbella ginsengisoli]|uniref:Uncharacterized protein n=1 Tax=Kribbella ginsengisoli TaxID=363865 RepID=A0ABP6VP23_9ACTN
MGSVPAERAGTAAGTISTARQVGVAVGIAVLGTVSVGQSPNRLGWGANLVQRLYDPLLGKRALSDSCRGKFRADVLDRFASVEATSVLDR